MESRFDIMSVQNIVILMWYYDDYNNIIAKDYVATQIKYLSMQVEHYNFHIKCWTWIHINSKNLFYLYVYIYAALNMYISVLWNYIEEKFLSLFVEKKN